MDISEILSDALRYPFQNVRAFVIYLILCIIIGIAACATVVGVLAGVAANNATTVLVSEILGVVVMLLVGFVVMGYQLDVIDYGIMRKNTAPEVDFKGQFMKGLKVFVVYVVYLIIPIIIAAILSFIFQSWLSLILSIIVYIIFGLALVMAQCRLAKTEELVSALAIQEAIADISRLGIVRVLSVVIIVGLITVIIGLIGQGLSGVNVYLGGIVSGLIGVYSVFFNGRAIGLLYSDL